MLGFVSLNNAIFCSFQFYTSVGILIIFWQSVHLLQIIRLIIDFKISGRSKIMVGQINFFQNFKFNLSFLCSKNITYLIS